MGFLKGLAALFNSDGKLSRHSKQKNRDSSSASIPEVRVTFSTNYSEALQPTPEELRRRDFQQLLNDARAISTDNIDKSIELVNTALLMFPGDWMGLKTLHKLLVKAKRYDEAFAALRKMAQSIDPNNPLEDHQQSAEVSKLSAACCEKEGKFKEFIWYELHSIWHDRIARAMQGYLRLDELDATDYFVRQKDRKTFKAMRDDNLCREFNDAVGQLWKAAKASFAKLNEIGQVKYSADNLILSKEFKEERNTNGLAFEASLAALMKKDHEFMSALAKLSDSEFSSLYKTYVQTQFPV